MIPERVIYTDGHDVTITDAKLQVKNHSYKLNGITKHGLLTMKPKRLPFIIILGIGLILAFIGLFVAFSYTIYIGTGYVTLNAIFLWTGIALLVAGSIALAINREKYAVRIDTAEGEKNAVVSTKKVYITQIVDALNEAFRTRTSRREDQLQTS